MNLFWTYSFISILEFTILLTYYKLFLGKRQEHLLFPVVVLCLHISYTTIMFSLTYTDSFIAPLLIHLFYSINALVLSLFYSQPMIKKLACALQYLAVMLGVNLLVRIITSMPVLPILSRESEGFIASLLHLLALFILITLSKKRGFYPENKLSIRFIFVSITTILILQLSSSLIQTPPSAFSRYSVGIFSSVVTVSLGILFLYESKKSQELPRELDALHARIHAESEYYEKLAQYGESLSKMRHDFRNRLIGILLSNEEQRSRQLKQLLEDIKEPNYEIYTKHPVINYLLQYKLAPLEISKANRRINIQVPEDLCIPSGELGVVLGNALDNAVQALLALPVSERILEIEMTFHLGVLEIHIVNSYQFPQIHRARAGHGYGLESIREIAEKHGGYLIIRPSIEGIYDLRIVMITP